MSNIVYEQGQDFILTPHFLHLSQSYNTTSVSCVYGASARVAVLVTAVQTQTTQSHMSAAFSPSASHLALRATSATI